MARCRRPEPRGHSIAAGRRERCAGSPAHGVRRLVAKLPVACLAPDALPLCTAQNPCSGRAGLVGTNTIRQNESGEASLGYIVENGGVITEAVSTQVWSGEAAVHVSIVNWEKRNDLANGRPSRRKRGARAPRPQFPAPRRKHRQPPASLAGPAPLVIRSLRRGRQRRRAGRPRSPMHVSPFAASPSSAAIPWTARGTTTNSRTSTHRSPSAPMSASAPPMPCPRRLIRSPFSPP